MPEPIVVKISVQDSDGSLATLNQAADKIRDFGRTADDTASGGLENLSRGMLDFVSNAMGMVGAAQSAADMVLQYNSLGVSVSRASDALNVFSNGQANAYLTGMQQASRGAIDNLSLARDATMALSTGIVQSQGDMDRLVQYGTMLGRVFQDDAQTGVAGLERDLQMVGNSRGLKQLGIDAQAVNAEFDKLKASGVDMQSAWDTAVLDQAGTMFDKLQGKVSDTGTALERLNTYLADLKQAAAENIAIGIEATIDFVVAMGTPQAAAATFQKIQGDGAPDQTPMSGGNFMAPFGAYYGMPAGNQSNQSQAYGPFAPSGTTPYIGNPMPTISDQDRSALYMTQSEFERRNQSADLQSYFQYKQMQPMLGAWATGVENPMNNALGPLKDDLTGITDKLQAGYNLQKMWGDASDLVAGATSRINAGLQAANQELQRAIQFESQLTGSFDQYAGGDLSSAGAAQRQKLAQTEKAKGYSQSRIDSDLSAFDAKQASLMDDFGIASGKATPEANLMKDALAEISSKAASGATSMAAAAKQMTILGQAAKDGIPDMQTFANLLENMNDPELAQMGRVQDRSLHTGHEAIRNYDIDPTTGKPTMTRRNPTAAETAAEQSANDPFADAKKSAKDLENQISGLSNRTLPAMQSAAQTAGSGLVAGLNPAQAALSGMSGIIAGINSQLNALSRSITITVSQSGGTGGAGTGSGRSGRATQTAM